MTALLSLLALAATTPGEPPLEVAPPSEIADAVLSCGRAVVGRTKVDQDALAADGWKAAETEGVFVTRRKPGNAAIIMSNHGRSVQLPETIFQEVCFVRGRVRTAADLTAVADRVTQLTGIKPSLNKREPDSWLWRGTTNWIAMEPFDTSPDGTPVTQFMVVPVPARPAWQRPTPNASSQDNQEPR
jgi:hypothetical protein